MKKFLILFTVAAIIVSCSGNRSDTTITTTDTLIGKDKLEQKGDSTSMQIDKLGDSAKRMMDKAAGNNEKKN
ncbi:MAG TPA: hypothetical protein VK498_05310 [Ferruginibacter sp.]|nr:hypothetical protein [Ferruginibacter sp.]